MATIRQDGHDEIVHFIQSLNVEAGQSLRQVMVPDRAYVIARNFLKWAPNVTLGSDNTSVPCRFRMLYFLPSGESIYVLLMMDAGNTSLTDASKKIDEWKEATKSLLRYALNLKLAPKRPEFQRMKLSSSYYVYQVAKKLQGAEKILLCMGYDQVSGSMSEIQELKYGGEVNTQRVIHTAADLVILHSELERLNDLVLGAQQENYRNVILRDILESRSDPSDTLDTTLRRSLTFSLHRLARSKSPPSVPLSQAPALPPRGAVPQRQQSAQLQLPDMHGQHSSLQYQQDNQNLLLNGRRSSVPEVQSSQSDRWVQPPPSPLLRQAEQPVAQQAPIPYPNSKDNYHRLDKTIDKSKGKGIDSVKYIPDTSTIAGSPVAKGASIPFDPLNLPEPAFDTHDLEMFHQETFIPEDSCVSSNMSLLINPRSTEFDDFSGPDLDDHLTYRSHDSGHMGLRESLEGSSALAKNEGKSEPEQKLYINEKESEYDDSCTSSSLFGTVKAPRIQDHHYEEVQPSKKDISSPGIAFQIGQRTSTDGQPSSIDSQSTQQPKPPVARPRSHSGGEKNLRQTEEGSHPSVVDTEHPPIPRPRSYQNLLSTKVLASPPASPNRSTCKPAVVPRKGSPRNDRSKESTNKDITSEDTCISQPLPRIEENLTIDDGAPTSHVTSMESSSSDNVHSEAHTSLESGSPHPSLESKPSMSNKSDPCSSTPPEKAPSACSGDKVFKESSIHSSFGEPWVDVSVDEKDSKDASTSLDSLPRGRDRVSAFSAKSVSDKSQKNILNEEGYIRASTDIQNAKACWYCTNLTTLEICDVCGNHQTKRETTV